MIVIGAEALAPNKYERSVGKEMPEQRGAEQQAGDDLADDAGLAQAAQQLVAERAPRRS